LAQRSFCCHSSKIRASCGNTARGDLCGGYRVTDIPTATRTVLLQIITKQGDTGITVSFNLKKWTILRPLKAERLGPLLFSKFRKLTSGSVPELGNERIVREELSSGHFQSVDELILSSVQAWRELESVDEKGYERVVSTTR
jgi:hypothetical protein